MTKMVDTWKVFYISGDSPLPEGDKSSRFHVLGNSGCSEMLQGPEFGPQVSKVVKHRLIFKNM